MARKDRERAYFRRLELVRRLGGRCVDCRTKGTKRNGLQIDHVNGRNYDVRKMDPSWRVSRYWQEFNDGVELAVRCKRCNGRKH